MFFHLILGGDDVLHLPQIPRVVFAGGKNILNRNPGPQRLRRDKQSVRPRCGKGRAERIRRAIAWRLDLIKPR